jgi:hypothetical protein
MREERRPGWELVTVTGARCGAVVVVVGLGDVAGAVLAAGEDAGVAVAAEAGVVAGFGPGGVAAAVFGVVELAGVVLGELAGADGAVAAATKAEPAAAAANDFELGIAAGAGWEWGAVAGAGWAGDAVRTAGEVAGVWTEPGAAVAEGGGDEDAGAELAAAAASAREPGGVTASGCEAAEAGRAGAVNDAVLAFGEVTGAGVELGADVDEEGRGADAGTEGEAEVGAGVVGAKIDRGVGGVCELGADDGVMGEAGAARAAVLAWGEATGVAAALDAVADVEGEEGGVEAGVELSAGGTNDREPVGAGRESGAVNIGWEEVDRGKEVVGGGREGAPGMGGARDAGCGDEIAGVEGEAGASCREGGLAVGEAVAAVWGGVTCKGRAGTTMGEAAGEIGVFAAGAGRIADEEVGGEPGAASEAVLAFGEVAGEGFETGAAEGTTGGGDGLADTAGETAGAGLAVAS